MTESIKVPDVPAPTAVLCWKQSRAMVRCDRKAEHGGLHSWEHERAEAPVAEQSVYESCQCPAKPGEPCPLSERDCADRVKKALAVRYLDRATKLSGCAWRCHLHFVLQGFDACCSHCQNIALAMVDAMTDGRYLSLTQRAEALAPPEPKRVQDVTVSACETSQTRENTNETLRTSDAMVGMARGAAGHHRTAGADPDHPDRHESVRVKDRYRYERLALKIVTEIKAQLLPAMEEEEGGWILGLILDLLVQVQLDAAEALAPPDPTLMREALEAVRWKLVLCGGCGLRYRRCVKCDTGVKLVNGHRKTPDREVQCGGHEDTPCDPMCIIAAALSPPRADAREAPPHEHGHDQDDPE